MKKSLIILIFFLLIPVLFVVAVMFGNYQRLNGTFGEQITLTGTAEPEGVTYPDGLNVRLIGIDDSRCKPDVQCIWAGELSANLSLTGGAISKGGIKEIRLAQTTAAEVRIDGYHFVLKSIYSNVTIIVEKE